MIFMHENFMNEITTYIKYWCHASVKSFLKAERYLLKKVIEARFSKKIIHHVVYGKKCLQFSVVSV